MLFRSVLVVSLLCALSLPVPGAAQSAERSATLGSGDALHIEVWRQPEFSGTFEIMPDGRLAHPLYRVLEVGGKPIDQIEGEVRGFLTRFESDPQFSIAGVLRIPVGGEVRQPTVLEVPPGTTLAQAIALAGGPTERSRLDRVTLLRDRSTTRVDLTRPGVEDQQLLRSGDQVFVERRRDIFREYVAPVSSVVSLLVAVTRLLL